MHKYEETIYRKSEILSLHWVLMQHVECIKAVVYILLSVDVPVLPYHIVL